MIAVTFTQAPQGANAQEDKVFERVSGFICRRRATVGWEAPLRGKCYPEEKKEFLLSLRNETHEKLYNCLKSIILNGPPRGARPEVSFDCCLAGFFLEQLTLKVPPEDAPELIKKNLSHLEKSHSAYAPASDFALCTLYDNLRRETMYGFRYIASAIAPASVDQMVDFLLDCLRKVNQGQGIDRPLQWNGEIWGMKLALFSILGVLIASASPANKKLIASTITSEYGKYKSPEFISWQVLKEVISNDNDSIPKILIGFEKEIEADDTTLLYFDQSELIPENLKQTIIVALQTMADDHTFADQKYAKEALKRLGVHV